MSRKSAISDCFTALRSAVSRKRLADPVLETIVRDVQSLFLTLLEGLLQWGEPVSIDCINVNPALD